MQKKHRGFLACFIEVSVWRSRQPLSAYSRVSYTKTQRIFLCGLFFPPANKIISLSTTPFLWRKDAPFANRKCPMHQSKKKCRKATGETFFEDKKGRVACIETEPTSSMVEAHKGAGPHDHTARGHMDGSALNFAADINRNDYNDGDGLDNYIGKMDEEERECLPVPNEILEMILGNLDRVDVVAASCVNTRWRAASRMPRTDVTSYMHSYASKLAGRGNLTTLRWARANGCSLDKEWCLYEAAEHGHTHVLRWARAIGCKWDPAVCAYAAKGGRVDVLEWSRANGCEWDQQTCAYAAASGHLETLQWARANGCPWDETTCSSAAEYGHIDVIKWARSQGCPWDEWTCTMAAIGGHLQVIQWARENGCPWDDRVCTAAAAFQHLDVLRWAVENGCPCYKGMWNEGEREGRKWARRHGYPWGRRIPDFPDA